MKIAVVIPCYKVTHHIQNVVSAIGPEVDVIYCVDDACPDHSGQFIEKHIQDPRVQVLYNEKNLGVGGAVMRGYQAALDDDVGIVVKIDGDGQMDPSLIPTFIQPITLNFCDYTKGNRFYHIEDVLQMPRVRVFGNAVLSFFTKLSSGYWSLFDPTNGYTAIHTNLLRVLPFHKIHQRFFFESDMLFRLNIARAVVMDIPMKALYRDEKSNLHALKIIPSFLYGHFKNTFKRLGYSYFLRDFNLASLEFVFGFILFIFGLIFGLYHWFSSAHLGEFTSAGTVMFSALPIIVGIQMLLSALSFDIACVPTHPIHLLLTKETSRA